MNKITRLLSILTYLQESRLITATTLAERFDVSVRTIYRDIRVLEEAGIPIVTEEGKGYSLLEGYRFPPVMLSESEVNALVTAEKLISKNTDSSLVKEYSEAMSKIKAILRYSTKDKADLLSNRVYFGANETKERTSTYLADIQNALTNYSVITISYEDESKSSTKREIEPFALLHEENWLLLAWCRLRGDYRFFRLDRIQQLSTTNIKFEPHQITLQQYFQKYYNVSINP